jgi:hypothetical protein
MLNFAVRLVEFAFYSGVWQFGASDARWFEMPSTVNIYSVSKLKFKLRIFAEVYEK